MKIFISWSGEVSKQIAEALADWLQHVIQEAEPFVSSQDLEVGTRWLSELDVELAGRTLGILCLTPTNLEKPWILFEAGALSKAVTNRVRVIPLLHGLEEADVRPPLSQFNMTKLNELGLLKVVKALNGSAERPLPEDRLVASFNRWWPEMASTVEALNASGSQGPRQQSTDREILEEILSSVRLLRNAQVHRAVDPAGIEFQESESPDWRRLLADIRVELLGVLGLRRGALEVVPLRTQDENVAVVISRIALNAEQREVIDEIGRSRGVRLHIASAVRTTPADSGAPRKGESD